MRKTHSEQTTDDLRADWKYRIIYGSLWMWNIPSRVQLDISLVRCTHLQDIKLNTRRALPYLQPFCL